MVLSPYFYSKVLGRLKNKVGDDGILRSFRDDQKLTLPPVNGSFYTEIMQLTNKRLKEKGDWIWLQNGLTQDTLRASEIEAATKRYIDHCLLNIQEHSVY